MAEGKKVFRRPWLADERELLSKHFADMDSRQLASRIGRPLTAVRQKAYEMGLKTNSYTGPWSKREVAILKELYPNTSTRSLAKRIGRSMQSVGQKALKLGLKKTDEYLASIGFVSQPKKWTRDDLALLRQMYHSNQVDQIAARLGRSLQTVRQQAHKMGLKKKDYAGWSADEIRKLRSEFPLKTIGHLAAELGRSVNSVRQKAHRLKLRKKKAHLEPAAIAPAV